MKTLIVLDRRHRHWVVGGASAAGRTNGSMTGANKIGRLGWLHAADPSHHAHHEDEAEAIAASRQRLP